MKIFRLRRAKQRKYNKISDFATIDLKMPPGRAANFLGKLFSRYVKNLKKNTVPKYGFQSRFTVIISVFPELSFFKGKPWETEMRTVNRALPTRHPLHSRMSFSFLCPYEHLPLVLCENELFLLLSRGSFGHIIYIT